MKCNKCDLNSTLMLRKKDPYCNDCFLTTTNHKFRACIGKNKILSRNENVMVCLSGGAGSTVLLDMIHHGISLDIHKKLRITPHFLHVADCEDNVTDALKQQCKKYTFDLHVINIYNYLQEDSIVNKEDEDLRTKFQDILKHTPFTALNDFLHKVRRCLYIKYAKHLNCRYVFTAETTGTLAVNLLSNVAVGRGSQVENDIGFMDSRDLFVKILRPMKDITEEELTHYIRLKGLSPVSRKGLLNNSIQAAISSFVTDLQENFQSTISAICRTADKIGVGLDNESKQCAICESNFSTSKNSLSALEATIFSRTVSEENHGNGNDNLFPYINDRLCYSCSRNYSEMNTTSPHLNSIIERL